MVGRWAGATEVTDLGFAEGRPVRLDERFELRADGTMSGDFAGWDDVSRCVVFYALEGRYAVDGDALDAGWDSVLVTVEGCSDDGQELDSTPVDADELALWNAELDGTWTATESSLSLVTADGVLAYARVTSPYFGRWEGTSEVLDFAFAEGRAVRLEETFWFNQDGTLGGYFHGFDIVSGCNVDYRLRGAWSASEGVDVGWNVISAETWGCLDGVFDAPVADVLASEGDLWNAELDGTWVVSGDTLTITGADGALVYTRAD